MGGTGWRWLRLGLGLALIGVLLVRFGAAPLVRGLRIADAGLVVSGLALTAAATLCCAWRWRAVAHALGTELDLGTAFRGCYASQLLNATLPAGVLGDVHRAVADGRRTGRLATSSRAVAWERCLGFVVQLAVTAAVVTLVPGPLRPFGAAAAVATAVAVLLALLCLAGVAGATPRRDLRRLLADRGVRVVVVPASVGVLACHAAVMLAALHAAGVEGGVRRTVPLALVVLLASTVPTSVAGWGPREGAAAWAFAIVGLGAADGVAASVGYGVTALLATVPGAVALLARPGRAPAVRPPADPEPARPVAREEVRHG